MKNKKIIFGLAVIVLAVLALASGFLFYKKDKNVETENNTKQIEIKPTLEIITDYQTKYFNIIKRNNVLLSVGEENELKKDSDELKNLYKEVESKINKDLEIYKKYKEIEEKYKENTGETTIEINSFAMEYYREVDKLLNEAYKEVKSVISNEEFNNLKLNQRAWLKEVEDYNSIFEKQDFGTIGSLVKLNYEIDMRSFRTLLLMMYLKNQDVVKLDDFLGSWAEVVAGRIYVEIKNKGDNVTVTYGGANSAYSHSESVYTCNFKNNSLICNFAKHTNQFVSCKGISSEDNLEEFLKCDEENPKLTKDDYKTYTDNKKRTIKIKKGTKNHFIIDKDEYMEEDRKNEIRKNYENMGLYFDEDKDLVFYKYKN